jgi:molybdate transport repressor ModE-like protein
MLDPRRLLTFHAVARAGSFSAAARELSLTQPAVSQQVAALERELGARLLHRGPGGLTQGASRSSTPTRSPSASPSPTPSSPSWARTR